MTINVQSNKVKHDGDGITKTFYYNFKIHDASDLEVYLVDADGTETLQSDYTVTNVGEDSGGDIIFGAVTPTAVQDVFIRRIVDITQETDYLPNDPFHAETHEDALDYRCMVEQQLDETFDRALVVPPSETGADLTIPGIQDRALHYIYFDESGNVSVATGTTITDLQGPVYLEDLTVSGTLHTIGAATFDGGLTVTSGTVTISDPSGIDHNLLLNYDIADHRQINDSAVTSTNLYSASKIDTLNTARINEISTASGVLQAQITSNDSDISDLEAADIALGIRIDTNVSNISTNASGISDNTTLINNNYTTLDNKIDTTSGTLQAELDGLSTDHGDLDGLGDDDHPQYYMKTGGQISGDVTILGDFTVSGTEFISNVETIEVSDNLLLINAGETGAGVTLGEAGIEVDRGSATNYRFMFDETNDHFEVGVSGTEQAVATREDSPTDTYVPYWNNSEYRFDTAGSMAYSDIASETYADGAASDAVSTHAALPNAHHNQTHDNSDHSETYLTTTSGGDHATLSGLGDDDHTQYSLADGTRAFSGTVEGVTPTADAHLATKGYVDTVSGTIAGVQGVGKTGQYAISNGVDEFTVTLPITMSGTDYDVVGMLVNTTDADPAKYGYIITNTTVSGFKVELSDTTDSANYLFNWRLGDMYDSGTGAGDNITAAGVTYENLDANGDVGTGATQVAQGDHTHTQGVAFGAILTTNSGSTGDTITVTVDDASTVFGNVLYQAADFNYDRADADAAATGPGYVLALSSGSGSKSVLVRGQACNTAWNWSAGKLYLSTTTGEMTQTKPSGSGDQVQVMGWALSADTIFFDPVTMVVEVA